MSNMDFRLVGALFSVWLLAASLSAAESTLVYEDANGVLQYGTYANRGQANSVNTVPDFSRCGYKGGGEPIPFVPAVVTINAPTGGDDTTLIQNAIDQVAALPLQANGFRGALLIKAGDYQVATTLTITARGIVIRGEGSQATGGTRITMTATVQDNLFEVAGSGSPATVGGTTKTITDSFVPVGDRSVTVSSTSGYSVGDTVRVQNTVNDQWIIDLGMNNLSATDPADTDWTAAGYQLYFERTVTEINGNTLTLDAPIVQTIEDQYGGGQVFKYTFNNQLSNVGFEALRLESTYLANDDEAHGWIGIKFNDVRDGWVRQVTGKYFGYGLVSVSGTCHFFTVEDCAMLDPKSITTGARKYSFNLDNCSYVLMQRCYTWGGRHDFVSGSKTPGPNTFVDCYAANTFADVGPHHRYATGQLYDNVKCGQLRVQNRLNSGSGHGWSGAQIMFWNCDSPSIVCDAPAGAMNWAIGCIGNHNQGQWKTEPDGIWESHGTHVTPRSLYYRQLQERLGTYALQTSILPQQDTGTVWTDLGNWGGNGLFLDDLVVWYDSRVRPLSTPASLRGIVRNLQMLDKGITTTWSKVSGPGTVTFGDASALETTATFSVVGIYELQILVDDGSRQVSKVVEITALSENNQPPVVNAGPDLTVALAPASNWTPKDIPTAAWYDANDASTIIETGGAVSQWNDKSGNGNHASQSTATQRPSTGTGSIGGLNALSFDPSADQFLSAVDSASLDLDGSGGANVFAVINYAGYLNQGSGLNSMLSKGQLLSAGTAYGIRVNSNNSLVFKAAADLNQTAGLHTSQDLIFSGVRNDAALSAQVFINGTLASSGTAAAIASDNTDALIIAGDSNSLRYADVDFGEIIIAGTALSTDDRQKMEGYLAHKWSLKTSLPDAHPYRTAVPVIPATAQVTLNGSANDLDGDPLTITWSLFDGPASVSFADSSSAVTTATFTQEGVYTLRLTAYDGTDAAYDDCVITVGNPEMSVLGNLTEIVSGDDTPDVADGTDFGNVDLDTVKDGVFTIANTGNFAVLTLGGNPIVSLTGDPAFTLYTPPAPTVAAETDTYFVIRFAPTESGIQRATISIANNDADENPYTFDVTGNGLTVGSPSVVATHIFYNNSAWDGTADDGAIATDKLPLRTGGTATFANYTSYLKGINGIMIDVENYSGTPTEDDLIFKVGNTATPTTNAPTPTSVTARDVAGGRRITITWADDAIKNTWLQVTVKATGTIGIDTDYVFTYGNAVAETGNDGTNTAVDVYDMLGARNNVTESNGADIENNYDFNRDKAVDVFDMLGARNNVTADGAGLKLITVP